MFIQVPFPHEIIRARASSSRAGFHDEKSARARRELLQNHRLSLPNGGADVRYRYWHAEPLWICSAFGSGTYGLQVLPTGHPTEPVSPPSVELHDS
jgi:hypothetical protein